MSALPCYPGKGQNQISGEASQREAEPDPPNSCWAASSTTHRPKLWRGDNSPKPTSLLVPSCGGWWGQLLDISMASSYSTDPDILIAFGGSMGHWNQHRPSCNKTTIPGMALNHSRCPESGGGSGFSQQGVPQHQAFPAPPISTAHWPRGVSFPSLLHMLTCFLQQKWTVVTWSKTFNKEFRWGTTITVCQ